MRAHVFISGYVQGVGFRHFVRKNAEKLALRGFVRNLEDGRVEAMFEGDKKEIDKMVAVCRKGPFLSSVRNLEIVEEDEKDEFQIFEVWH
jgi:acylphosphatase